MKILDNIKGAKGGIELDNAIDFKKAILSALQLEQSEPLVIIWFDKKMKALNYALGSGATNLDQHSKTYLLSVMGRAISDIQNGKLPTDKGN